MRLTEISLFGDYVRADLLDDGAGGGLRDHDRAAARFGLLSYVWHPAVFVFAVYMIVLMMLLAARRRSPISEVEAKAKHDPPIGDLGIPRPPEPVTHEAAKPYIELSRF